MLKKFKDHPATVGETYFEHMHASSYFGSRMIIGGFACFIHALLPFLFMKTGSGIVTELHGKMVSHRDKRISQPSDFTEEAVIANQ